MVVQSAIVSGLRGWQALPENDPENVEGDYGVEYEVMRDDPEYGAELSEMSNDHRDRNVGPLTTPAHVPCEEPNCPLPAGKVRILDHLLSSEVDTTPNTDAGRRILWEKGLEILVLLLNDTTLPDEATPEDYGLE